MTQAKIKCNTRSKKMDFFPDIDTLSLWLVNYGSVALFVLLCVGIIALPVPEETLMIIAGALMRHDKLNIPATITAAILGSLCGITVSYLLGRLAGDYLLSKYGKWIGLTPIRRKKVHDWFERFGKWALPIGYFIPGIRHFTGFIAGSTKLEIKHFMLYAYSGGILWVSVFLSLGYFTGRYWVTAFEERSLDSIFLFGAVAILICALLLFKKVRRK